MKPVMQTKFGDPEGNCFQACLASLLELPIDEVPSFREKDWWGAFRTFLKKYGLVSVNINMRDQLSIVPHYTFCIAGGKAARGLEHSVVWQTGSYSSPGRVIHDPHPDGTGLEGKPRDLTFIMPADPNFLCH